MTLFYIALGLLLGGGVAALVVSRSPRTISTIGAGSSVLACLLGIFAAGRALLTSQTIVESRLRETLFGGNLSTGVDPLSSFFLLPVFVLGLFAALYGREYMMAYAGRRWLGPPWAGFNLLLASLTMVLIARDALTFLISWELMSLAAYSLVAFEHEVESTRRAGWIYLIASHIAMALLILMFLVLARETGSFEIKPATVASSSLLFVLAILGFGIKAGFVPLHVWLPEAHAAAPSHVSAMMSGVLIKMGLYGLLRMIDTIGPPAAWWGPVLMIIGAIGGVVGIGVALYQRDLKRIFAYSSVENMGIILLGVGIALWGKETGNAEIAALGFSGALLHVWNHALIKGLLFMTAGSVLHGTGTKDLARLGGLLKRMPHTGLLMIGGAISISALPPLNIFAGEWLIYLGLIQAGIPHANTRTGIVSLLAVGMMALIGTLAVLCFVRVIGIALLGSPRDSRASEAHESPRAMLAPMIALFALSAAIAVFPGFVVEKIGLVFQTKVSAPLFQLGLFNAGVLAAIAVIALILRRAIRRNGSTTSETWGCGYAAPTARMQYGPGSFSELFVEHLLPRTLRARVARTSKQELFRPEMRFAADSADPLTRGVYEPFLSRWADRLARVRWLQQGILHVYIIYILIVLVAGLVWMSIRNWSWIR